MTVPCLSQASSSSITGLQPSQGNVGQSTTPIWCGYGRGSGCLGPGNLSAGIGINPQVQATNTSNMDGTISNPAGADVTDTSDVGNSTPTATSAVTVFTGSGTTVSLCNGMLILSALVVSMLDRMW